MFIYLYSLLLYLCTYIHTYLGKHNTFRKRDHIASFLNKKFRQNKTGLHCKSKLNTLPHQTYGPNSNLVIIAMDRISFFNCSLLLLVRSLHIPLYVYAYHMNKQPLHDTHTHTHTHTHTQKPKRHIHDQTCYSINTLKSATERKN